jgi:hypothetical protein
VSCETCEGCRSCVRCEACSNCKTCTDCVECEGGCAGLEECRGSEDVLHIFEAFAAKKDVPEEAEQAIKEEVEKILAEANKKFAEILDSHGLELYDIQHFIRRKS